MLCFCFSHEHMSRHLVDGGAHTALQHHLQHLGVRRVLVGGEGELLSLLLHVLDRHLHGDEDDLEKSREREKRHVSFFHVHTEQETGGRHAPPLCG